MRSFPTCDAPVLLSAAASSFLSPNLANTFVLTVGVFAGKNAASTPVAACIDSFTVIIVHELELF